MDLIENWPLEKLKECVRVNRLRGCSRMNKKELSECIKKYMEINMGDIEYPKCIKFYMKCNPYSMSIGDMILNCGQWSMGIKLAVRPITPITIYHAIIWMQNFTIFKNREKRFNLSEQLCGWLLEIIYNCSKISNNEIIYELVQYADIINDNETPEWARYIFKKKMVWFKILLFYMEQFMDIVIYHGSIKRWLTYLPNNPEYNHYVIKNNKVTLHPIIHLFFTIYQFKTRFDLILLPTLESLKIKTESIV